jgi:hypothetical protein
MVVNTYQPTGPIRLDENVGHQASGNRFGLPPHVAITPQEPPASIEDDFSAVRTMEVVAHRRTPAMEDPPVLQGLSALHSRTLLML